MVIGIAFTSLKIVDDRKEILMKSEEIYTDRKSEKRNY